MMKKTQFFISKLLLKLKKKVFSEFFPAFLKSLLYRENLGEELLKSVKYSLEIKYFQRELQSPPWRPN